MYKKRYGQSNWKNGSHCPKKTEEFTFTYDGVHPNINGQQYLAKKVVDAIITK